MRTKGERGRAGPRGRGLPQAPPRRFAASPARPPSPQTSPVSRGAPALRDPPTHRDPEKLILQRSAQAGTDRRGAPGPGSASALGAQRPGPCRPSRGRAVLVSRGSSNRLPPSALLLLLLLRAAGKQIPISAASAAEDASSRSGGGAARGGRGGQGERRRRARALGRTRQLCAHPSRGAGPAPDTNGAESSAEVPEGPVEHGAPLPGRRAGGRHGGARLPREGGPAFRARRRHHHPRDGGAAGTGLRGVDHAGTPLLEPKLGPHVSGGVAPKAPSSRGAGSLARLDCDRKEKCSRTAFLTHPPHLRSRVLDLALGVGHGGARVLGGH